MIGTASEVNHEYLRGLGATPVAYGDGQVERIRAVADTIDVAFDAAGHDNLRDAVELVADRTRIATIVDMRLAAALGCRVLRSQRSATRLATLALLVADGRLRVHVRRVYPLAEAPDAHRDVESGHGRGKVVLAVGMPR
ncbi:zinc-binding dehydrogenase [Plantactinospora sp. GCM10030261]|uniref:zinc-binding dehydrogenase n=1 Tax=Plantactinospora sp. GCM10030261 TaxID=3273420 RepID=UPI0036186A75